jgi:hypothetical protein
MAKKTIKVKKVQVVRKLIVIEMPAADVVSISRAAELANIAVSTVSRWMDAGKVPVFYLVKAEGTRVRDRYTSLKAVRSQTTFLGIGNDDKGLPLLSDDSSVTNHLSLVATATN